MKKAKASLCEAWKSSNKICTSTAVNEYSIDQSQCVTNSETLIQSTFEKSRLVITKIETVSTAKMVIIYADRWKEHWQLRRW